MAKWRTVQSKILIENIEIGRLSQNEAPFIFKVQAVNLVGAGVPSKKSDPIDLKQPTLIKLSRNIPGKPGKPHALSITHDSIQLTWTKPEKGNENITSYTILYRSQFNDPPNQWMEERSTSTENTTIVSHLFENATYLFQILPECEVGVGLGSDVSDPITTKLIIPSKPGKPRAKKVTNDSIAVKWTKPEQGAHNITSYTVFCCSTTDPIDIWNEQTTLLSEEMVLTQLPDNTTYRFKIRPECEAGSGIESDTSDPITTRMIIPTKPGKPTAMNIMHDSIQLEWMKPEQGAHNITLYAILYRSANDLPDQWIQHRLQSTNEKSTVSELLEYTFYHFKVKPKCEVGFGLESDISDPIQTKMIIPSKPGKPKASKVTHDNVQLEWTKPEQGAHNITFYTVFYCCITCDSHGLTWREYKAGIKEEITVQQLSDNMVYFFKIRPECEAGNGLESDISEPIRTKVMIPSQPGKPKCSNVSHDSIQLEWTKPEQGAHNITAYHIFYRCHNDFPDQWIKQKVKGAKETATVSHLLEKAVYSFKVQPECIDGVGSESDISEPIATKMIILRKPGKPEAFTVTHDSIELTWSKPVYTVQEALNETSYSVFYRAIFGPACTVYRHEQSDSPEKWKEQSFAAYEYPVTICNLETETIYIFKVRANCEIGVSEDSEISNPIKTEPKLNVAMRFKKVSRCIKHTEGIDIYSLPLTPLIPEDHKQGIAKYCVGNPQDLSTEHPEKVLMIVGATGSGKSTLINGIANYIMGIKWEDSFRFIVTCDKLSESLAFSSTAIVTAYSFPVSLLPYNLTVIDTPGFGDSRGLDRDERIFAQIKHFFSLSSSEGIGHIDGLGFVVQSPQIRLTPTQKYIIDCILSMVGKDAASNMFWITTFADGHFPPVMDAIKTYTKSTNPSIPLNLQLFKFNNSALFTKPQASKFDQMFWKMGFGSFHDLFNHLGQSIPQTLTLTMSVLDEYIKLQMLIENVQRHVCSGMDNLKEMCGAIRVLKDYEAEMRANENFTYEIKVPKYEEESLPEHTFILNCLVCHQTCFDPWVIPRLGDKYDENLIKRTCLVMDISGHCKVCVNRCNWKLHQRCNFRTVLSYYTKTGTFDELESKYRDAKQGKAKAETMILRLKAEVNKTFENLCIDFDKIQLCLEHLEKAPLRPNPLIFESEYVELLIRSEKEELQPGWEERIKYYEKAREVTEIVAHAKKGKIPQHMHLEALMNDSLKDVHIQDSEVSE